VIIIEVGTSVDTDATTSPFKANDLASADGLRWVCSTSTPEHGLGGNTYNVTVAKVLGGGSVITHRLTPRPARRRRRRIPRPRRRLPHPRRGGQVHARRRDSRSAAGARHVVAEDGAPVGLVSDDA